MGGLRTGATRLWEACAVIEEVGEGLARLLLAALRLLGRFVLEVVGEAALEAISDRWSSRRTKRAGRRAEG